MTPLFCGIIIKVRNLERCRNFYRDVLRLGNPVTDSNFRCEFSLGSGMRLVLCKAREEEQLAETTRSAVWLVPEDPAFQLDLLASYGCLPGADELNLLYPNVKCYRDPENNPVYIVTEPMK